jgi:hypothetical protein
MKLALPVRRGSKHAHTKPHERGKIASEARVKKPRPDKLGSNKDQDKLEKIIARDFSGMIIAGHDLMKIEVQFRNLGPSGAAIVVIEDCARFARF